MKKTRKSSENCKKFRLLGIENSISVKCGELKKWDISDPIKKEGIVIHSTSLSYGLRKHFLLKIDPIKNIAKRNRIIRKFFGRNELKRKESGIVELIGGTVIDSRHY